VFKYLLIVGCVKWRAKTACNPDGSSDHARDKSCNEPIGNEAGYCQCHNEKTAVKKGCGLPERYGYSYNTCEEACFEKGK